MKISITASEFAESSAKLQLVESPESGEPAPLVAWF
jgi:hypothetical protein